MIKPTIGRVVWYHPIGRDDTLDVIHAAIITYVWTDNLINLVAFDNNGVSYGKTSVQLWHGDGERPKGHYAEWMPYQLGQAAKTEALEAKLGGLPEDIRAATRSDPAFDNLPRA